MPHTRAHKMTTPPDTCGSCGADTGQSTSYPWHLKHEDCRAVRPPMTRAQMTPGPWKVDMSVDQDRIFIRGTRPVDPEADGRVVCELLNTDDEALPDARAISLVPEMVAFIAFIEHAFRGTDRDTFEQIADMARALLARVEGA